MAFTVSYPSATLRKDGVEFPVDAKNPDGWAHATSVVSDDPFFLRAGEGLGKTAAEMHALIQFAAGL